jgi:hypothetical protein
VEERLGERVVGDEELLELAEALAGSDELPSTETAFVKKIVKTLKAEKDLTKKDKARLVELYQEYLGGKEVPKVQDDDEIDEDDFM